MFRLINLSSGDYLHNERTQLSYDDGKRAARAARLATVILKTKVQVRRVSDGDGNWRERERGRLDNGDYTPLNNLLRYWSQVMFPDHFAHVAKKRPGLVAYTKDDAKGRADIQSVMSYESYIDMLWEKTGENDTHFSAYYKQRTIDAHAAYVATLTQSFKLATTPDEIERVYTRHYGEGQVAGSCMRYTASHWPSVDGEGFHPARIYGAGDLAVAYLADASGKTIARALCWPECKKYSRVYADNDTLHRLLREAGYTKTRYYPDGEGSLRGARLLRVENDNGYLVCPYLDEVGTVDDMGDWLKFGGSINAQETGGTVAQTPEGYQCDHCAEYCDEDEISEVYTRSSGGEEYWCSHCREHHAFYCEGSRREYSDAVDHSEVDGRLYCVAWLVDSASMCERTDEWTFDPVEVIVNADGDTETWSWDAAFTDAYEYDGRYYSEDVEFTEVVVERYVPAFAQRYQSGRDAACPLWLTPSRHSGRLYHMGNKDGWLPSHTFNSNVWFKDRVEQVPDHLLTDDHMIGLDGKRYLRGYHDNYPVARERLDVDLVTMMEWKEAA